MSLAASSACLQAALLVSSPFAYAPAVEEPRSFGHFVGDVLTQRIPLDVPDRHVHPSSLPPADRVGLWFQRLAPHLETDAGGGRWLVIDYQVINSPSMPVSAALPALLIATDSSAPIQIAPWPIHLSPLSAKPAYANIDPLPLRPDRLPAPLPTRVLQRQVLAWSAALAVVLCAWLAWILWRDRRDAERLPFARALAQLRAQGADADAAGAWICLHRALNETAGRAIHEGSLTQLFETAPHLAPVRGELESFYRISSARFFAGSGSPSDTPFPLLDLCRQLRRIEMRESRGHAVRP